VNDKKIAFIFCVNDHGLYQESIRYIRSLDVPLGYEIDLVPIEGALSMCSGYNKGMSQSDAKFKVYLHQDVFIVNKNFILDFLSLFKKNPTLGLLGVAGAKQFPSSGIWWESSSKFGKVYDSTTSIITLSEFEEVQEDFEIVEAVDGLIMVTQYDITWREDLFTGWHFYDLSQCMEFKAKGYSVGIPRQERPWCVHDCGVVNISNGFDEYKSIFLDTYMNNNGTSNNYAVKPEEYYKGINKNILKHIKKNSASVLDVGCAQGNLGRVIKEEFGSTVIGIEAFPNAAMEAREKLDEVYDENIENFNMPFKKESFDHIIFGDVLEHLNDPWLTLKNIRPFLKKDGSIITSIPNIAHITTVVDLLQGKWTYQDAGLMDKTHLRFFTKTEIEKMFNECGYNVVNIESIVVSNEVYDKVISYLYKLLSDINLVGEEFVRQSVAYQYVVVAEKQL
jgi:2-polyprenyl-3-methyl-5-hydroxy-6-metoxy-1,4-benzoquinol methylase